MCYVFADCELDIQLYVLRRADRVIALRPKVFQVLLYLLQHHDRVVSKHELLEAMWPEQFISDATLADCIRAIRQAVGEQGRNQRILQTRHGHGYRIMVAVTMPAETALKPLADSPPAAAVPDSFSAAPVPSTPQSQASKPCAVCHQGNSVEALFCGACGTRLQQVCLHCGQQVRLPVLFCGMCGHALNGPVSASALEAQMASMPIGEHKRVTVLCCALAEVSQWRERLGLDALHTLMRTLYTVTRQVVQQYGGALQSMSGGRLLTVFGAPMAQEDHAYRALLAAQELRQRLHSLEPAGGGTAGETLAVCIGLHTGLAAVGGIGQSPEVAPALIGDVESIAMGLQEQAAPGTILCSETTARLVPGMMHLEAVSPIAVPGQRQPIASYRILGRKRRAPTARSERRTLTRFVGRAPELAILQALLAQVEEGQGHVVGIVGEPGIGKSRLLYEFRQCIQEKTVTYLQGRCLSYSMMTPYLPILDLVRHNCGLTEADVPESILEKVHRALREIGLDPDEWAPYLLHLLGVREGMDRLACLDPLALKMRTFALLTQMCLKGSQRRPLIVEVEDLHWIDSTSDECLTGLVERLAGTCLLLLVTYRPGYRPGWLEKSYATQLALHRLTQHDSQQVMQFLLPVEQLPRALAQEMVTKAAGNPFFLEELAQTLVEHEADRLPLSVPDTIEDVLLARIDSLRATEKRLLQTASVIGTVVPVPLLQAVTALPEAAVHQGLRQLQAAEFLYETQLVPYPLYSFKHVLTQEVAYQALLQSTRQQYHQNVAHILAEQFPETVETQPELLAHHYTAAGLLQPALTFWQRAGQWANARAACGEAIGHFRQGLTLLQTFPETRQRAEQELDLQMSLGSACIAIQGPVAPEVEQAYGRARVLCQQIGPTPQLVWALEGLWAFYLVRGNFQLAQELGLQLLQVAEHLQHPLSLVVAHQAVGLVLFYLGNFVNARTHLEYGITHYDPGRRRAQSGRGVHDPGIMCHAFAGLTLCLLGYPEQAVQRSHAMLALAQELAHPHSLAFAWCAAAVTQQCCRVAPATQTCAEAAIALAKAHGFPLWLGMGTVLRGWALAVQGDSAGGIDQIRRGLKIWHATGAANVYPYFLVLLADAYRLTGQREAGLAALDEARTLIATTGERWWEAETSRLTGELLLPGRVDVAQAACWMQQALVKARQQHARLWELRAALSLGRVLQQQGQRAQARHLVASVYDWFTEGFAMADVQDARAQLMLLS